MSSELKASRVGRDCLKVAAERLGETVAREAAARELKAGVSAAERLAEGAGDDVGLGAGERGLLGAYTALVHACLMLGFLFVADLQTAIDSSESGARLQILLPVARVGARDAD